MGFDWAILFEFLLQLIDRCAQRREDRINVAKANKTSVRGFLAVNKGLRAQGLKGAALREASRNAWADVQTLDDDDIGDLVNIDYEF